jgi:hypothetical protein
VYVYYDFALQGRRLRALQGSARLRVDSGLFIMIVICKVRSTRLRADHGAFALRLCFARY